MTEKLKKNAKRATTIISCAAIVVICVVWWINGAELEDAWLYVFAISIVLIPVLETVFKKKGGDQ